MDKSWHPAYQTKDQPLPKELEGEICFGALYDSYALPTGIELASELLSHQPPGLEGFVAFEIRTSDRPMVLRPLSGGSKDIAFAVLDKNTSTKIRAIDYVDARFEALVEVEQLRLRGSGNAGATPRVLEITINLYGLWPVGMGIRCRLLGVSAFLQDPKALADGGRYTNPHLLVLPDDELDMRRHVGGVKRSISGWRDKEIDPLSIIFEPPQDHQLRAQDSRSEDVV